MNFPLQNRENLNCEKNSKSLRVIKGKNTRTSWLPHDVLVSNQRAFAQERAPYFKTIVLNISIIQ